MAATGTRFPNSLNGEEDANLAAFCQRCHILHDCDEHQRRR